MDNTSLPQSHQYVENQTKKNYSLENGYRIVLNTMRPLIQYDLKYNARKLPQNILIMRP